MAHISSTGQQFYAAETNFPTTNDSLIPFNNNRRLVCVEHPAVIRNLDRGLQSLGGTKEIAKTYNQETKRLEMRCRPDDPFCKPAYGDRIASTNLLMKVKRRRKRTRGQEIAYEYCVEIVGIIETTYKFQAMVDFQYLPVTRNQDGSYESLLEKLMLKSFVKKADFLKRDVPLFLTPLIFSRMDLPCDYDFRPDRGHTLKKTEQALYLPDNQIGIARHKRCIYTMFVNYDDPTPTEPQAGAEDFLIPRFNKNTEFLEYVRKLFVERPIWSKNALRCQVHPKLECRLKYVLPLLAYYMTTGPWRSMWVRIGWDPRINPSAKKYQILDFRIRQRGACDPLPIKGKRGVFSYSTPMSNTRYRPTVPQIPSSAPKTEVVNEFKKSIYIFDPSVIPPYRQMFYQLCDMNDNSIQKIVSENDGQETVCTEKEGWLSKDTTYKCRQILSDSIESMLMKTSAGGTAFSILGESEAGRTDRLRGDIESKSEDELELDLAGEETLNDMETEMLDCI